MGVRRVRIDYNSKHAPGLFVIRCKKDGRIEAENSNLSIRQDKNGAGITKKAVTKGGNGKD